METTNNAGVQLKQKVVLKEKDASAAIGIQGMLIELKWKTDVDLDLMIFGKNKRGNTVAIFTKNLGGNEGDLNAAPFMQLSGDAGVGGNDDTSDLQESLTVTHLDEIDYVDIVTLNYTDAAAGKNVTFSEYGATVTLTDNTGNNIEVPLDSTTPGHVALIATIKTSAIGAELVNKNEIMSLQDAVANIHGFVEITK